MRAQLSSHEKRPLRDGAAADLSDERLVRACLRGDERAWAALIDRYKRLILSFPRRYGASPDDAADVFQLVCVELFAELPRLRNPGAVRAWLTKVALHHAYDWNRCHRTRTKREGTDLETAEGELTPVPDGMIERAEREQIVRDAIRLLPPRCRTLIQLMFYEQPALPYQEIARRFGVAEGSIGFIRGRCLKKLESELARRGMRW
jgi:RNA polymerase sigma factor (sigma-70 family)